MKTSFIALAAALSLAIGCGLDPACPEVALDEAGGVQPAAPADPAAPVAPPADEPADAPVDVPGDEPSAPTEPTDPTEPTPPVDEPEGEDPQAPPPEEVPPCGCESDPTDPPVVEPEPPVTEEEPPVAEEPPVEEPPAQEEPPVEELPANLDVIKVSADGKTFELSTMYLKGNNCAELRGQDFPGVSWTSGPSACDEDGNGYVTFTVPEGSGSAKFTFVGVANTYWADYGSENYDYLMQNSEASLDYVGCTATACDLYANITDGVMSSVDNLSL